MGFYKQCSCPTNTVVKGKGSCEHAVWMQFRGKRFSMEKWARKRITTFEDAEQVRRVAEQAILDGTFHRGLRPDTYLFEDLIKDYLDLYFLPKGRVYEKKEEYRFDAIQKRFKGIRPEDLSLVDVDRWVLELKRRGLGAATIRKYIARLKAIMTWGFNRELVPSIKVRWGALDLDPDPDGRARRLAEGEEETLKQSADPWMRQLIEVALDTGLRAGSLLGLQFRMVDFVQNHILVPRKLLKNKKATHDLKVPMTARVKAIVEFRRILRMQNDQTFGKLPESAYIFGSAWGKKRKDFRRAWDATRKAANIKKVKGDWDLHFHDLRGEFATRLHEANVPIETISHLLDHSTIEMTRKYIKVRTRSSKPAEAIQALEQLQGLFPQGPSVEEPKRVM